MTGATRISAARIAEQFKALQGREIDASALKPALDAVNALFVEGGLPLGRAFVPAQHLKGGVLQVNVVEGFVNTVVVQADKADVKALVTYMAAPITQERPLTRATMERVLLLIQDLPGMTLGSSFTDVDPQNGGVTLLLNASVKTVSIGFSLDNRANLGSLPVLPYAITSFNNLLGMGDQLVLTALLSPRQKDDAFYALSASRPIGTGGLSAVIEGAWAQTLDNVSLRPYEVRARSTQLSTSLRYAVVKATDESLTAHAKLYFTRTAYGLTGLSKLLAEDQFVASELGADYGRALSSDLGLGASMTLTQGLASLTGEPHTRLNSAPAFTKLRLQGRLIWSPIDNATLNFSAIGQYSPNSLLAAEEIAFGGLSYGRAFNAAEITGDSGFGLSFQPQYRIPLGGAWSVSPFLSGDYAKSFNRKRDLQSNDELVSAGFGTKIGLGGYADLSLELDKPLNRTPFETRGRAWRFFAGVDLSLEKAADLMGKFR